MCRQIGLHHLQILFKFEKVPLHTYVSCSWPTLTIMCKPIWDVNMVPLAAAPTVTMPKLHEHCSPKINDFPLDNLPFFLFHINFSTHLCLPVLNVVFICVPTVRRETICNLNEIWQSGKNYCHIQNVSLTHLPFFRRLFAWPIRRRTRKEIDSSVHTHTEFMNDAKYFLDREDEISNLTDFRFSRKSYFTRQNTFRSHLNFIFAMLVYRDRHFFCVMRLKRDLSWEKSNLFFALFVSWKKKLHRLSSWKHRVKR